MGFLSAYSGTRKVPIGDPDRGYWVELREHVSKGAVENAERALTSGRLVPGQQVEMTMDTARYRQLMVLAAIADWNLDEDDGTPWVVNLTNVQRLPASEFDKLQQIVDEMNAPASAEERRRFPDGGPGGDPDGDGGAAVPVDVLA